MKKRLPLNISLLIIIGIIARLIFASTISLVVDEFYVAAISRKLSLSYFEHPPLHFWIIHFTAWLTGSESPIILRLPFILLFAGTTWLMYAVTSQLFDRKAGFYAALTLNLAAVFSVSTGTWLLPDGPLMFFMMAAVFVLIKLLFPPDKGKSIGLWILCGLLIGLGMLSKYHAAFVLIGGLFFILTARKWRYLLLKPGPYITVIIAAIVFIPVIIWNIQHDWISFTFQGVRGAAKGFFPDQMLLNIVGQMIWVLPWIWIPLVWQLLNGLKDGPANGENEITDRDKTWFLCCLALGPIMLFTVITLWGRSGLPHWQAPGYLMVFPLLGRWTSKRLPHKSKSTYTWLTVSALALILFVGVLVSHTVTGWVKDIRPGWFTNGDPSIELIDWPQLPKELQKRGLLPPAPAAPGFVATTHWIEAGKYDYTLGGKLPVLCLSREPHHFVFLHDQSAYINKTALIISEEKGADHKLAPYFDSITKLAPINIYRNGRVDMVLLIYLAKGFKGYPLPYGPGVTD